MTRFPVLITAIILSANLHAAGGGGEEKDPSPYLELDPDFVLNIGDPEEGRHYVKADAAVRFENGELREKGEVHEPWLRHELVMLLSGQPVDRLKSVEGQDKLQKEARKVLNRRLEQEMPRTADSGDEGKQIIREVLFEMIVHAR